MLVLCTIFIVPEVKRHRWESRFANQLSGLSKEFLAIVIEDGHVHAHHTSLVAVMRLD